MKTTFLAENTHWLLNSPKTSLFVYFELQAPKFESDKKRLPLNLSLVIDRSGSMEGDKLTYAKKALDFVIQNLTTDDALSIVQYDNQIDVVSPSKRLTDKMALHKLVQGIEARGMTNLSGGMLEGYKQVVSTKATNFVNRVLLLSDGLANEGVTDTTQLQKIAQQRFREDGVALSTFGVGADFNEVLMTNLSEYGNGNYYFIEKPDSIPAIFAKELEGLLAVVAQNTKLAIHFPEANLKFVKSYGYPTHMAGKEVEVNFHDMVSEEKKAVLLRFEVIKPFETPLNLESVLAFDDVIDTFGRQTIRETITILPTQDSELFAKGINKTIIEQIALFEANDMFEEAIREADNRNFEKAKQIIAQVKMYLETHFKHIPANEELKKQYQTILDYAQRLEQVENMSKEEFNISQKSSRSSHYDLKRKK